MSVRTREDRVELQALDDGDPDDDVFRLTRWTYHDDRDCSRLLGRNRESIEEETRAYAQRCWAGPCHECVLEESKV